MPAVREGTKTVIAPDVYYFDNPERQYAFTTISSFDTTSAKEKEAKTYLVGSGNLLYVSENAMYITYQKYHNVYRTMRGGAGDCSRRADRHTQGRGHGFRFRQCSDLVSGPLGGLQQDERD